MDINERGFGNNNPHINSSVQYGLITSPLRIVSRQNIFFTSRFSPNDHLSDIQVKLLKITSKLSHASISNQIIEYDTLVVPGTPTNIELYSVLLKT